MVPRQDLILAVIRTAVPGAIGYLLAQLIAAIPFVADAIALIDRVLADALAPYGMQVTVLALLNAAAVALVIAGYYWVARELGRRWPAIERFLLGSAKQPVYIDAGTAGEGAVAVTTQPPVDDDEPKHRA